MFRGVRPVVLFDIMVVLFGLALLLDHWRPLTGSSLEATLTNADPVCRYSVYTGKSRRNGVYPILPPISGKCVETEIDAKQLVKVGYNRVSKGWMVRATIDDEESSAEFYLYDASYLATKQSWDLFLWGDRKLEKGRRVYLLRSATGYSVTPLKEPQLFTDKLWALYQVVIGLLLSFGTLAIHALHYLHSPSLNHD